MDHIFAPGVASVLLGIVFLLTIVVGAVTGAMRALGWGDKRIAKISAAAVKALLSSKELKTLMVEMGAEILTVHETACVTAHAELHGANVVLQEHDRERKAEMERTRTQMDALNRQVIDLALHVAGVRMEAKGDER